MNNQFHRSNSERPMPDYQVFPVGIWHMLGAVLLMVASLISAVILFSGIAGLWVEEQALMYIELAVLVVLALILSTSTFLLSRGWSVFHAFLIWHNRIYLLVLAVGSLLALVLATTGLAIVGLAGLGFGLLAHRLYCSEKYSRGVEYYRLIWTHHRNTRND